MLHHASQIQQLVQIALMVVRVPRIVQRPTQTEQAASHIANHVQQPINVLEQRAGY